MCGVTVVWCECGESVKAEREEQKQMVRACLEQRERSKSRWCVRAWSERGVSVASRSERFCVLQALTLFLCFALFGTDGHTRVNREKERTGRMP